MRIETSQHEDYADDERMGDVIGALLMIKSLAGAASKEEDVWFEALTGGERDPLKTGELLRGCSTLMRCWFGTMQPDDPLHVAAGILNRVRRLDIVDDSDLPMVSAILTCVVLDQSPIQWVSRAVAEFTSGDQQGWILATWQVADLFDFCAERPGAAVGGFAGEKRLQLSVSPDRTPCTSHVDVGEFRHQAVAAVRAPQSVRHGAVEPRKALVTGSRPDRPVQDRRRIDTRVWSLLTDLDHGHDQPREVETDRYLRSLLTYIATVDLAERVLLELSASPEASEPV